MPTYNINIPTLVTQTITNGVTAYAPSENAVFDALALKESALTFSLGLTRTANNITNDLITGIAGGQTIIGGTAVGNGLIYKGTTANATLTAAAHTFVGGNNGATELLRINNNGNIGVGVVPANIVRFKINTTAGTHSCALALSMTGTGAGSGINPVALSVGNFVTQTSDTNTGISVSVGNSQIRNTGISNVVTGTGSVLNIGHDLTMSGDGTVSQVTEGYKAVITGSAAFTGTIYGANIAVVSLNSGVGTLLGLQIATSGGATNTALNILSGSIKYATGTPGVGKVLMDDGAGTGVVAWTTPATSGTVTSVAWTTSQGVSASIANATTTPDITITLGALTGVTSFNGLVVTANTGVITTGTWNAGVVSGQYGGTGVANTGFTITLAGSLVTTGAFTSTFAASATATYTLPTATSTLLAASLGISGGTIIIGGTATTDDLTFRTTSGAGTTGADFIWQGGNNGATELMRLLNNGNLLNGIAANTSTRQVVEVSRTVNDNILFSIKNLTSGTVASAGFRAANSGGELMDFQMLSAAYSTSGGSIARSAFVGSSGTAGLVLSAYDAAGVLRIYTGGNAAGNLRTIISAAGLVTWSAAYHLLSAGTATAATAPLKFQSGTNLTTAEAGAMEYNGTNLFFTRTGTTRQTVLTANVVTTEVVVSDTTVTVNVAGTDFKFLARA